MAGLLSSDNTKRGAIVAFSIRVTSAALAFLSQILLARWLGAHEFGVFTYIWVWVNIVATLASLGFATTVIRFVAEYAQAGRDDLTRGFFFTGRCVAALGASVCAVLGAVALVLFGDQIEPYYQLPAALALLCLPAFAMTDFQDGIGRAKGWIDLALGPPYIVRPLLLLGLLGCGVLIGAAADARTAVIAAVIATWLTALVQFLLQRQRMPANLREGPREYMVGHWLKVSLPVIAMISFGLLMMQLDVLLLNLFVTPDQIAIYFAAAKTITLINFVHFSIQAPAMSKFAALIAAGEQHKLRALLVTCRKWMFGLSLVGALIVLTLGKPILWLFGESFVSGYPVMVALAVGLLIRALAGPLQGLLVVAGQQNLAALALGVATLVNVVLNLLFIPRYGLLGAGVATAMAFAVESLLFFLLSRRVMGDLAAEPAPQEV
jgi:O-antigen/teichoic acid export membrane protein